ncbi:MAG: OmpA family protein [Endozoicomonas sp. (ex Botrylloides leachii)]|nr:OmpA family protein [Endozoicomonas sp. (ex Botrylloides leachii)]
MTSRILTFGILTASIFLTGCSTTNSSIAEKKMLKCAATGGAVWGIPGAVHGLATGGASLAAGALVAGVACATDNEYADNDVLPVPGIDGTTVARFNINSAHLDGNSKTALDSFLKDRMKDRLIIIGHTCDLGSKTYNKTLSEKRANAVKAYLVNKGFNPERVKILAKGEDQPLYSNTSDENREKNRRVEIIIQD